MNLVTKLVLDRKFFFIQLVFGAILIYRLFIIYRTSLVLSRIQTSFFFMYSFIWSLCTRLLKDLIWKSCFAATVTSVIWSDLDPLSFLKCSLHTCKLFDYPCVIMASSTTRPFFKNEKARFKTEDIPKCFCKYAHFLRVFNAVVSSIDYLCIFDYVQLMLHKTITLSNSCNLDFFS